MVGRSSHYFGGLLPCLCLVRQTYPLGVCAMTTAIILLFAFGIITVTIYCITHSLAWYAYWRQRAHRVLGNSYDLRWNTGLKT